MRLMIVLLGLGMLVAGCVSYDVDDKGNPVKREGLSKELVFDGAGRFMSIATHLSPPHTIIVNGKKPTEREIRLLGVEGKPEGEAPNTYRQCQEWMAEYLTHGETLYIKPQRGADTKEYVIFAEVYLDAVDDNGKRVDGYVMVNMAMLSLGLVKIRDVREFSTPEIQKAMQDVEDKARREKLGLWSDKP